MLALVLWMKFRRSPRFVLSFPHKRFTENRRAHRKHKIL